MHLQIPLMKKSFAVSFFVYTNPYEVLNNGVKGGILDGKSRKKRGGRA